MRTQSQSGIRRVRWVCAGTFLLAGALLSAVRDRAREAIVDAATLEEERVATRIVDAIEAELSEILEREERRSVLDWRAAGERAGKWTPSPLATGPWPPAVVGYVEIDGVGTTRSPSVPDGRWPEDVALPLSARDQPVLSALAAWIESTTTTRLAAADALALEQTKEAPPEPPWEPKSSGARSRGSTWGRGAMGAERGARWAEAKGGGLPAAGHKRSGKDLEADASTAKPEAAGEDTKKGLADSFEEALVLEQKLSKGAARRSGRESRKETLASSNVSLYQQEQLPQAVREQEVAPGGPGLMRDQALSSQRPAGTPAMEDQPTSPNGLPAEQATAVSGENAGAEVEGRPEERQEVRVAAKNTEVGDPAQVSNPSATARDGRAATSARFDAPRRETEQERPIPPRVSALDVDVGPFARVAHSTHLVLVRTVRLGPESLLQAVVFEPHALRDHLVQTVLGGAAAGSPTVRWGEGAALAAPFDTLRLVVEPHTDAGLTGEPWRLLDLLSAAILAAIGIGLFAVERAAAASLGFAERRSNFVAAVSHELKTPLTAIRMYAEMLDDGIVADEEARTRYYRTVRRESERLGRLVEQVLELGRLERGARTVHWEQGDLGPLLGDVAATLRPRAEELGFRLSVEVDPEAPSVRFDRDAITQILHNLCDNALKFSAAAEDRTVHLRLERCGTGARIEVRDHGPGVPEPLLERIFEPFFRGGHELVRTTQGTGIGLGLVRGLCEQMGTRPRATLPTGGGLAVSIDLAG